MVLHWILSPNGQIYLIYSYFPLKKVLNIQRPFFFSTQYSRVVQTVLNTLGICYSSLESKIEKSLLI